MARINSIRPLVLTTSVAAMSMISPGQIQAQEVLLEGISIYATASGDTTAFAYPGQVSVIDRSQIQDFVATRPEDVFQGTPGVTFGGGPRLSGQVPTIRGFEGEALVILFDDARQNFASGHDGRFFIDTDILVAAEVVKGPTSSVYGSGAVGGVFAFRTIDAADLLGPGENAAVRVKAGFNTVDSQQTYAVTGVQASESRDIDLVANFGYRDSRDIELGSGDTLPADNDLTNALVKGTFNFGNGFKSTTSWIYTNLNALDPQNPQGVNVGGPGNPLVDRKVLSTTLQTKLEYDPTGNDLIDSRVVLYRSFNGVEEPEVESGRLTTRDVETLGFKADNTSRFELAPDALAKFTYGTDIYRDEQTGEDSASADGARGGVPDATSTFIGFFAEAQFEFGKPDQAFGQLRLVPGIRYDSFASRSDIAGDVDETAISPKIAAAYQPVEWFQVFGNYGKAFRAPSYNEAYSIGNHFVIPLGPNLIANDFIPNPGLQPETAIGWEAGASFKFANVLTAGDVLRLKGSYWENEVEDLIELEVLTPFENLSPRCFAPPGTPFPPFIPPCIGGASVGWTSQNVNVQNALLDGIEIEAVYDSRYFFLRATYDEINGRDLDTGGFAGNLYPRRFFVDGAVKFPDHDFRLGARATFADDFTQDDDPAMFRASYEVYDIYAVWQPDDGMFEGLRVDLGIDNVADADYEIVSAGVSEEGRDFKAAVTYQVPICGTEFCRR